MSKAPSKNGYGSLRNVGMFVLEGHQLEALRDALNDRGTNLYKLRINVNDLEGESFTYKVNEGSWSPPVGQAEYSY